MGLYILLVEDDHHYRRALRRLLEQHEHTVCEAWTADAALTAMRVERPDLILLDISLPDRSGVYVRAEQLEDPEIAEIPCFIISGLDPSDIRAMGERPNPLSMIQVILGKTPQDHDRLMNWIAHIERDKQLQK